MDELQPRILLAEDDDAMCSFLTRALENVPATLAIEKDEDGYPIADAAQEAALDD